MKNILILSTGDTAGAYEAMFKVGEVLLGMGHHVRLLVKTRTKNENFIVEYKYPSKTLSLSKRIFKKIKNRVIAQDSLKPIFNTKEDADAKYSFFSYDEASVNLDPERIVRQIGFVPDLIFVGMTVNFCNSTDLRRLVEYTEAQLYNITVDMNHFTGGCHFAWDCEGYIKGCGEQCPAILNENFSNLAKINFSIKETNARLGGFKILSGSGHTLNQARSSKIYKDQEVIYNINSLIDTNVLNAKHRLHSKFVFDFDPIKFYILTGAQNMEDPRKGFVHLVEALDKLRNLLSPEQRDNVVLVVVSRKGNASFESINFEKVYLDYIKDYRLLAQLYKAVDLFVNTSVEDSGPMMVSEALACGTPVVGFDTGILVNMVENGVTGFKVPVKDENALANAIKKVMSLSKDDYLLMSSNGTSFVENYSSYTYASSVLKKIIDEKTD